MALGLDIIELSPAELTRATSLRREIKVLSKPDSFAFSLAESRRWTLLTGDGALRTLADEQDVATPGILWIVEELLNGGITRAEHSTKL